MQGAVWMHDRLNLSRIFRISLTDPLSISFEGDPRQRNVPAGRQVGFSVAEVRINAGTGELCAGSPKAFRDLKVQRISHSETLQVSVAFAVVEQAFEEF
jgi:hypothetical protein